MNNEDQAALQSVVNSAFTTGALEALMNAANSVEHGEVRDKLIVMMGSIIIKSESEKTQAAVESVEKFETDFWTDYQRIAELES